MRKSLLIGVSSFVLGAGPMAYVEPSGERARAESRAETFKMLELFGDVVTNVENQYVTPVDNKKLIEAAIDGMLTSLDPHSDYLNPEDYRDLQDQTRGYYGGLGLRGDLRRGRGQGDLADGRHPGGQGRACRPGDYITADRRPEHDRPDR